MAGTIIDALVVTLGLDSSGFKKGKKEVGEGLTETRATAEETAKNMEAAGKRAASFFGSIRTELLALVGVTLSAQGIKTFITSMTSNLMQLGISSRSLDMSAKSLDGWQRAAEAAGSSAEKITGNLQSFQDLITTFRGGGNVQGNPLLMALNGFSGATGAKFDLGRMSSDDVLKTIAANWNKLNKDAQRKFGADIGLDGATQQALTSGKLTTDADRFSKISRATDDATQKALDFNRRLEEMKQNFSAAAQVLYEALIPYVEKLIPLIEKVGIWITENGPQIERFFSDSAAEVNKVVDAVGGWQNALEILAAFVAGSWALRMLSGIGRVRGAFAPLLAAIAVVSAWDKLGKNDEEAQKQGKSTGQYLIDRMNDEAAKRESSGTTIGDRITNWWSKVTRGGAPVAMSPQQQYTQDAIKNAGFPAMLSQPRGIRNNNPGNLNYAGQAGATKEAGENGRFAVFSSMQEGVGALYRQLQLYFKRGVNTIEAIVNKYAPAGDNNNVAAYIQQLVGATGKGSGDKLSGEDTDTVFKLMRGIINHENGKGYLSDTDIMGGIQLGAGATASRNAPTNTNSPQASKNEFHIGEVRLQTSASNANALGNDLNRKVQRQSLVSAYTTGQG